MTSFIYFLFGLVSFFFFLSFFLGKKFTDIYKD